MSHDWQWLCVICAILAVVQSLPTTDVNDENNKKTDDELRPKGTLSNSGLEDKSENDNDSSEQPKALPSTYSMEQQPPSVAQQNNYQYGKILVNELEDSLPRNWNPYVSRYGIYAFPEDRRKRSDENPKKQPASIAGSSVASNTPSTSSPSTTTTTVAPQAPSDQPPVPNSQLTSIQSKRSVPPYYQEPRYKRDSDMSVEELLELFAVLERERQNRLQNWGSYGNSGEYENLSEDNNLIGIEDEDPSRGILSGRHYLSSDPLLGSPADLELIRNRPSNYYDQYLSQLYGQQYEDALQYGIPKYSVPLSQRTFYPSQEKRFMISRKRSVQNYEPALYRDQMSSSRNSMIYPYNLYRLGY